MSIEVKNASAFDVTPYLRFVAVAAPNQIRAGDGINVIYYRHPGTTFSAADYVNSFEPDDMSYHDRFAAYTSIPVVARHTEAARAVIADTLNARLGANAFTEVTPEEECLELVERAYAEDLVVASAQRQVLIFVDADVPDRLRTAQRLDMYTCHVIAFVHSDLQIMKTAKSAAVPGVYYRAFNCSLPHLAA
jgi:hypothetical protein